MMKKTFMLAGMIAVGVGLTSTSALADTQGTQTFTANIKDSTCVITGLNESLTYPTFSVADILAAGDNTDTSIDNYIGSHYIKVVGCPSGVSKMNVQATYNINPRFGTNKPVVALTGGTGKGIALWLYKAAASGGTNYWFSGQTVTQSIVNGQASQIVGVIPYGDFPNGKSDIVAGNYEGVVNFAVDFT